MTTDVPLNTMRARSVAECVVVPLSSQASDVFFRIIAECENRHSIHVVPRET
jgi:hypothetical protein